MAWPGRFYFYPQFLFLLVFLACRNEHQQTVSEDSLKERMIHVNKYMVQDESKEIEKFINGKSWKMNSTGTGLRFEIYKQGNGKNPSSGSRVVISYSLSLLDGTKCNPENENTLQAVMLGQNSQLRGLAEGILLMHEGDQARLVIPSHLGFGIQGDGNRIPGLSPLYCDVSLLKVENSQDE